MWNAVKAPSGRSATRVNNHQPREAEICMGIADPEKYAGNWNLPELMGI